MHSRENYKILNKLSKDKKEKFGIVHLVENVYDNQKYILKSLPKNALSYALDLLENERTFSINHPQIQHCITSWETEDTYCLLKSYHEGTSLEIYFKTLKKRDRLPFLLQLAEQLNDLLQIIHQKGYVHADLKPSNILIDSKGEVKIIDFGLAIEKGKEILPRPTLFSLGYAAPEIVLNHWSLVDETADYFSVGVLFHKLITGDLPWKHSNPSIMTNLQITYPLPAHSKLNKTLHKLLADLTFKYQFKTSPAKMTLTDLQAALKIGIAQREKSLIPLINYLKQQNQKTSIWAWFKT